MPTIPIRWADNTDQLRANLKAGLNQIEATRASAEKMAQSLGGEKLIAAAHKYAAAIQQIGGVEKLTAAEKQRINALVDKAIEKYTVLGQVAPTALRDLHAATKQSATSMTGLASSVGTLVGVFTAGAVLSFARDILADADALSKLRDQTGISVEGLQGLRAAADETGNSLEEVTSAITQMQNRLASGDTAAVAALRRIGVSIEDLLRLSPDRQFEEIGRAIAGISDPAQQVAIAMDIFGRSGAKVLPTLKADFEKVREGSVAMSADTVDAFDRMGDAATRYGRTLKAIGASVAAAIFEQFEAPVLRMARELERVAKMAAAVPRPNIGGTGTSVPGLPSDAQMALILGDLNDRLRENQQATKDAAEAQKKAQQATEKWAAEGQRLLETLDKLEIITPGLRQAVGELDSTELKAIETWLEKARAAEELRKEIEKLYDAVRKLEQVKAGEIDLGALPSGTVDVETIARLKSQFDIKPATDSLRLLSDTIAQLGSVSRGAFGDLTIGISQMVQNIANLRQAITAFGVSSLNAALAAFQLGMAIGNLIGRFFRWLFGGSGSGPGGMSGAARRAADAANRSPIPRFASGGFVDKPTLAIVGDSPGGEFWIPQHLVPRGGMSTSTFTGSDMQRAASAVAAVNGGVASGPVAPVVHNDMRGSFFGANAGREIARLSGRYLARDIAENKGGLYSRMRASMGQTS